MFLQCWIHQNNFPPVFIRLFFKNFRSLVFLGQIDVSTCVTVNTLYTHNCCLLPVRLFLLLPIYFTVKLEYLPVIWRVEREGGRQAETDLLTAICLSINTSVCLSDHPTVSLAVRLYINLPSVPGPGQFQAPVWYCVGLRPIGQRPVRQG